MINQNPSSSHHDHDLDHHGNSSTKSLRYYVIEGLLLVMLLCVYNFKTLLHYPSLVMKFLYYFQMYFSLELLLVLGAGLAKMMFGLEVEPQFDNLSLSTSTQNFWGRRWNLVSSSILRSTVYDPVRRICSSTCIIGKSLGLYVAVVATFVVSGIMHELLFYYIGRIWPVWDVFWFFALSGICLSVEIAVKKALKGRWQLNQLISRPLTLGFIVVTAFWLLFPVFERIGVDIRVNQELAIFGQFVKGGSE
ncbi:hypothetical protein BVC80_8687g17 [Macleaya cordata]|uniref:Wax synthase domain-containing protein n=1 Tax=Macleaya cordata TaxID=56857 RepID=A0A200QLA3_MACCD|nr:hypothetical protein BVC80_8687g17 [Macleaya cordata]